MSDVEDNLDEVRAALRADAAAVAEALLGAPSKAHSTKNTLRWGGKGSLALEVRGPKRGLWFTHEGDEGSDLLGLIQHVHGCSFPIALAWARSWTGLAGDNAAPVEMRPRPSAPSMPDADEVAEVAAELAERIATAQRIAAVAQPAAPGTPADWYLRQARGIPRPAAGWPDAIRWHPGYRALVAVATLADGTVQAVQRIHLGRDGEKIGADEMQARQLRAIKITNGSTDSAAVRLPGDPAGPLLLAEGPETGLSGWSSTGHETWIALGAIGKLQPPAGRRVVVLSDDNPPAHDARQGAAAKALAKAVTAWRKAGVSLVVATPWEVRRRDKSDLADVVLLHGPDAVQARIAAALGTTTATTRIPVQEARQAVAVAVGTFFDRVDTLSRVAAGETMEHPGLAMFTSAVRVDVGVGKSHEARRRAATLLASMRARGDMRTVVLSIPTHALGEEQALAFMNLPEARRAGLKAAIWRGRAATDPDQVQLDMFGKRRATQPTMCGDLERVRDAQAVGLAVQTAVCKGKAKDEDGAKVAAVCPLLHGCAYQAQMQRKADLWIVPHSSLFHEKPKTVGEVAAVIVDESAWHQGLTGAEGRHNSLSLDALEQDGTVRYRNSSVDRAGTDRLAFLRGRLLDLLRALPDGPVHRDAFQGSLLTAESAAEAARLEWDRKVEALHPGQTRAERRQAMEAAEGNRSIVRLAMAWGALRTLLAAGGPDASGWLALATERGKEGPVRVLRLKGRAEVKEGWRAPTLLLDALLPVELVRPFWPDVELVADVKAAMPHQHIRQVTNRAYAKSMFEPLTGGDDKPLDTEEGRRRTNRLHDLRDLLVREGRRYAPGKVLVVAQQAVEAALRDLPSLPPNIDLAHHNAVAGRDEWRDVAALIVVGRTLPGPSGVERIAEALTGRAMPAPAAWYERADAAREMVDGSTVPADADRHPNTMAEAIRWQIAEGELVQIIGRGRGVNRTAADPLDVLVLTDLVLPMPLTATLEAADLEPNVADRMIAAGGVVFENPTDAAAAYPALWANREAAKKALQRGKLGTFPYNSTSIGECPQLRRLDYKPAGQGRSASVAGFDPVLCPDPATFLASALGPLAWCKVADELPPDPGPHDPAPPPSRAPQAVSQPSADPPALSFPLTAPAAELRQAADPPSSPVYREPPTMTADLPAHDLDLDQPNAGLPCGIPFPSGLSLSPHPGFAAYDALPVMGTWRIRRPALPDLVVSEVCRPWRTAQGGELGPPPLIRVQGADGVAEPAGLSAPDGALRILGMLASPASRSPA